jgi:hypothetical protein
MSKVYHTRNAIGQDCFVQFQYGSTNSKTGDGVQIWILPSDWIIRGKDAMSDDEASCLDCPHSKRANRTCYVRKGNAEMGLKSKVASLHKAYTLGKLEILPMSSAMDEVSKCAGKFVRFGAYGEPVLLGEKIVSAIANASANWTGYTHQWRTPVYKWAAKYFMASVETEALRDVSHRIGWRSFHVIIDNNKQSTNHVVQMHDKVEVVCPASKEAGQKTTCNKCGLCKGTSSKAKSIRIIKH